MTRSILGIALCALTIPALAAPALALEPINTEKHINETLLQRLAEAGGADA
ncbi:MAG: hypothetical protein RI979_2298, partial [Pseudomonadota bacterium]